MNLIDMELIEICRTIANGIYNDLGKGFEEVIYQNAFEVALRLNQISYESQKVVPVFYQGYNIGEQRLDLVLSHHNVQLIVELKATLSLSLKDDIQIWKYMELLNIDIGMLINFWQLGTTLTKINSSNEPDFRVFINNINDMER